MVSSRKPNLPDSGDANLRLVKNIAASIVFWPWIAALTVVLFFIELLVSVRWHAADPLRKRVHSQCFWWSDAVLAANPFWRLDVQGMEHIDPDRTYVIVCNHRSIADIVVLYQTRMQFKWVAKDSLFRVPFLGWCLRLARHISFKRRTMAGVIHVYRMSAKWLEDDVSVLFFPEGSRSREGEVGEFHNGAFKLAVRKNVAVLPIALQGTGNAIPKGSRLVASSARIRMTILPPIESGEFEANGHERLKETAITRIKDVLSRPS